MLSIQGNSYPLTGCAFLSTHDVETCRYHVGGLPALDEPMLDRKLKQTVSRLNVMTIQA